MDPLEINYELKRRGITQQQIADEVGVTQVSISYTIHKKRVSDRIMRAVASKIGKDHRHVFPEHYIDKKREAA